MWKIIYNFVAHFNEQRLRHSLNVAKALNQTFEEVQKYFFCASFLF